MRTIPDISEDLKQFDEVVTTRFIIQPKTIERNFFSLPPSQGGLGIPIFSELADHEFANSTLLTEQLQKNILSQEPPNNIDNEAIRRQSTESNSTRQSTTTNSSKPPEKHCLTIRTSSSTSATKKVHLSG